VDLGGVLSPSAAYTADDNIVNTTNAAVITDFILLSL